MKYVVIRASYNQIIDVATDSEALQMAKKICNKPSDMVFVVKEGDLIRKKD